MHVNMNGSKHIMYKHVLTNGDGVLEVVPVPRHEADHDVSTQGKFTIRHRRPIGDDVACGNLVAFAYDGPLVNTGVLVRARKLLQMVHILFRAKRIVALLLLRLDADDLAIGVFDLAVSHCADHSTGIARGYMLEPRTNEGGLCFQQRHRLALHIRPHQGAIGIVVLEEWYQRGGNTHQLLSGYVHIIHFRRRNTREIALPTAEDQVFYETTLVVNRRVGLGYGVIVFVISGQHLDLVVDHTPVFHFTIGRLKEAEIVDARIGGQRGHQSNIGALRRLDGTDAAIMRGMHVAHFKPSALAA